MPAQIVNLIRLLRLVRESFLDPAKTLDILVAAPAVALGIWMAHPHYMEHRYPMVAEELKAMAPIWLWAALLISKGLLSIMATELGWRQTVVACHIVGTTLWAFLWTFFNSPKYPPSMAYICPVMAWAAVARLLQIPKGDE